jgi:hypothetical protein
VAGQTGRPQARRLSTDRSGRSSGRAALGWLTGVDEALPPVIGVVGGSGGVGASTFAAGLARLAGRGTATGRSVLVEVDPVSGGIDVLLGAEAVPGPRWSGLRLAGGRLDPDVLAAGLPAWSTVAFVAADVAPTPEAVAQLLPVAREVGPVVVDVPRWPAPSRPPALAGCDLVVLVCGSTVAAAAAARCVADGLGPTVRLAAVVRGGSAPHQVADLVGAPLVGRVPDLRRVSPEPATWPPALRRVASGVLDAWGG